MPEAMIVVSHPRLQTCRDTVVGSFGRLAPQCAACGSRFPIFLGSPSRRNSGLTTAPTPPRSRRRSPSSSLAARVSDLI
jgi:hypothetical protein